MSEANGTKRIPTDEEMARYYVRTGIDMSRCEECGAKLDLTNAYHLRYGTCDCYCYAKLVGADI